jgi:predicted O-methyltransferase YrrM
MPDLARTLLAHAAAARIHHFVSAHPSTEERLKFLLSFTGHGDTSIRILQAGHEILDLCHLLEEDAPHRVLEIGTCGGGTLFLFAGVAADDAVLVSVDLPPPHGYAAHRECILRGFATDEQTVHPVRADSHDPRTVEQVAEILGGPVDFLFIDGDHSPYSVRRDWELYAPLVRPGGIVAFHDIVPGEFVGGVPEFWERLKEETDAEPLELIQDPGTQENFGIGVLQLAA